MVAVMWRGAWEWSDGGGAYRYFGLACCSSCIPGSTPRVIKIGLIAPFEGLYRRTGYAALDEMHKTLAANAPASTAFRIMPVALDDGGDPEQARRAAQKLLVDPEVRAIVGPLFPQTIAAVQEVMQLRPDVLWLPVDQLWSVQIDPLPASPSRGRSFNPLPSRGGLGRGEQWPGHYESVLIATVAEYAALQGADRLLLAGGDVGAAAQNESLQFSQTDIPVQFADEPTAVQADDAVLWLGDPAGAANFLNRLRLDQPQVPFWMGVNGGDPVFAERAQSLDNVYWAIEVDDGFDAWLQATPAAPPLAYLIYQATQLAIAVVENQASPSAWTRSDLVDSPPHFQLYQIRTDGVSSPVDAASLPR
ncbi:MAG: hypothetical protein R2911_42195 [Caldilineaceae bacterium]